MVVKNFIVIFLRMLLRAFYICPIKNNRIIFMAYDGNAYACNPKYIFEYLYEKDGNKFEYIWVLDQNTYVLPLNVKTISKNTFSFFYNILTAHFIVTNNALRSILPKRKGQILINTWHGGGAYKKVGMDVCNYNAMVTKIWSKETDYVISSCRDFTNAMSHALQIDTDHFILCGMPRNDIFFKSANECMLQTIRNKYHIPTNVKVILYAPTFRGTTSNGRFNNELNMDMCLNALNKRFGGQWILMYRYHYHTNTVSRKNINGIDVSNYPDMQELLCLADVMITDYSSCMWDISLAFKPCFIYAPDIWTYLEERDFYTPMDKWPYPLAFSMQELIENIRMFDFEAYKKNVNKHHIDLGSYETGTACEAIGKLLTW